MNLRSANLVEVHKSISIPSERGDGEQNLI